MGLKFASIFTLSLFSTFMFIIIFLVNFFLEGQIGNLGIIIGIIVLINFVMWLIAPFFQDLIYNFFYKSKWITLDDIASTSPKTAKVIQKICEENKIKMPKFGLIEDENPTAFTYGSGKWNARIFISQGIVSFLEDEERAAVYAHELGHIKNNDFIVMTIASTIVQILYEIYATFMKIAEKSGNRSSDNNSGKAFLIIGLISYAFYFISQFVLLYLSRIREYYADEVSGKYTDPNALSSALIKIAYGILVTPNNNRLIESTKYTGITNSKMARTIGAVYYNSGQDSKNELIEKSFLFDLKNPWAKLSEIFSTHPLTGNRIKRLMKLTNKPQYDLEGIEKKYPVDKARLYKGFALDFFIMYSIYILPIVFIIASLLLDETFQSGFFALFAGIGSAILLKTFRSYPNQNEEIKTTTVLELMSDVYASPVKGKNVKLNGEIIGKGNAGYAFSEDVMFKDNTGLMYLDYQSKIPLIGNFIFSISKVKKLIGKKVITTGWFFRGIGHYTVINEMRQNEFSAEDGALNIKGGAKFWGIISGVFFIAIGFVTFGLTTGMFG